jgi:hypothetical protein
MCKIIDEVLNKLLEHETYVHTMVVTGEYKQYLINLYQFFN